MSEVGEGGRSVGMLDARINMIKCVKCVLYNNNNNNNNNNDNNNDILCRIKCDKILCVCVAQVYPYLSTPPRVILTLQATLTYT